MWNGIRFRLGYSIFYPYKGMDLKIKRLPYNFFLGFLLYLKVYFSRGQICSYLFLGGRLKLCSGSYHFLPRDCIIFEGNHLTMGKIEFQGIFESVILSRVYWFLKIWPSITDKKWNSPFLVVSIFLLIISVQNIFLNDDFCKPAIICVSNKVLAQTLICAEV